jgi:hypothetical protein
MAGTSATLVVGVSGLVPASLKASVKVTGRQHFARMMTRSATLRGLVPGNYRITARAVATADGDAVATVVPATIRLAKGARSRVVVTYTMPPANLLTNPGGETGALVSPAPGFTAYSTPGWTPAGYSVSTPGNPKDLPAANRFPYATTYDGGIPGGLTTTSPGPRDRGDRYFAGGTRRRQTQSA